MDLKDFVKGVIFDVTNAIKESQQEMSNGAIISPSNKHAKEKIQAEIGDLQISYIDFEVAVTVESSNEIKGEAKGGIGSKIHVISAWINGKLGTESKLSNENISKVKFSIPVIYPTTGVKERLIPRPVAGRPYL